MRYYQAGLGILFSLALVLFYTNCSTGLMPAETSPMDLSSSIPGFECEEHIALRAEIPSTIDDMTEFINSLPKPLSLPCLIAAFEPPLSVYAVASPLSAQPSVRPESPRIFIIKNNLLLSVVPEGLGKDLIEFGEITGNMRSLKAELEFPITTQLSLGAPYEHIKDATFPLGGTNCRFCHASETKVNNVGLGEAYISALSPPNPNHRIPIEALRNLAINCSLESEPFRCAMLRFVALSGEATDIVAFPTEPL